MKRSVVFASIAAFGALGVSQAAEAVNWVCVGDVEGPASSAASHYLTVTDNGSVVESRLSWQPPLKDSGQVPSVVIVHFPGPLRADQSLALGTPYSVMAVNMIALKPPPHSDRAWVEVTVDGTSARREWQMYRERVAELRQGRGDRNAEAFFGSVPFSAEGGEAALLKEVAVASRLEVRVVGTEGEVIASSAFDLGDAQGRERLVQQAVTAAFAASATPKKSCKRER